MPATVIGAMNGDKPTWTLVAHVGIIGHDRVLVSLAAPHFINGIIRENKTLSINIVDEGILPISNTYVEEGYLDGARKIDYRTLKPVLFEFPTYEYLKTGEVIGKCLSLKNGESI